MKIYFLLWDTGLTGGNRAIFEVANRLSRRGYRVEAIAFAGDHRWIRVEVPIHYITPPRVMTMLIRAYRALKLRRKQPDMIDVSFFAERLGFHADLIRTLSENIPSDCDACIATYYQTAISLYLSGIKGRMLYFVQDFHELVRENAGDYGLRLFELTLRIPFDYFLTVSTYMKSMIEGVNPTARVLVTHVGVDTNIFKPRSEKIVNSGGKRVVMVIIRGAKYKGDEIAIQALNLISKVIPIHAVIVGNRRLAEQYFKLYRPNFTYEVFENVDDETLAKLYSSADVFLYTSYVEGFGLPPLEAMASGTAVVTTDCKGNRDYAVDGWNALVVPPGDPEAVANAAIKLLRDEELRTRLIQNGLETARKFTWDKVTDVFEKAIRG